MNLFLVVYLAGGSAILPIDTDRAGCEAAARSEQARLAKLVDPEVRVRCERYGPEHMIWRMHPELKGR